MANYPVGIEEQLELHEGRRKYPYKDTVGKLTIGVGWNLDAHGLPDFIIDMLLEYSIEEHWDELLEALPWVQDLDQVRQRVLLDMAFNLGVPGLLKFKNTLKAVREERWDDAASGMLASKWARQVGQRAKRLAKMMRTGVDIFGGVR